jgi:hypothetical protein
MKTKMESLSITNQTVIGFYKNHPQLNFESMNILFVEILNKLFSEISPDMNNNFALSIIKEIKNVSDCMGNLQKDNINNVSLKFAEMRKEYIQDLQIILNNNNTNSIKPLLLEYTQILQDKTKIIIDDKINTLHTSVNDIKSINGISVERQNDMDNKINEVLKKFDSSSKKGNVSEMVMYNLLKTIYSENQLKIVNTTKETGDILLIRKDKDIIILENKDYKDDVIQTEVDKFIRDINTQNCSGIFISQNSKIANKKTFEIGFYGNNIGIYLSNVKYDTDIIQIAIDTIDAIKSKITTVVINEDQDSIDININNQDLLIINNEYQILVNQKIKHIKTIKEFSKKLITETEGFNIPTLYNILVENYGTNKNTEWECNLCGKSFLSKASHASHYKKHVREQKENNE